MKNSKRDSTPAQMMRWAALVAVVAAATGVVPVTGRVTAAAQAAPSVVVAPGDVQDLYAKLKDQATAHHDLLLSGTYILTAEGEGAATKGYIELGDRNLIGTNRNVDFDDDGIPDAAGE